MEMNSVVYAKLTFLFQLYRLLQSAIKVKEDKVFKNKTESVQEMCRNWYDEVFNKIKYCEMNKIKYTSSMMDGRNN